jgi:hypothetical protein
MKTTIVPARIRAVFIKPTKKEPRKDWEGFFKQTKKLRKDNLLISDNVDLDMKEWKW